jgi:hypothetical protein
MADETVAPEVGAPERLAPDPARIADPGCGTGAVLIVPRRSDRR